MLEDGDGRLRELADEAGGRGDIEDVIEGEFLAVELFEVVEEVSVEFGLLMGVLTVAEASGEGEFEGEGFPRGTLVIKVGADGAIVGAGGREGFHREACAKFRGRGAVTKLHGFKDAGVVGGVDDNGDGAVVLGSAANHGGAADIDLFDGLFERDPLLCDRLFKGVEIHADQINRQDAMLGCLRPVLVVVAEEKQSSVNFRDEGLHAAIHHLRKTGVVGDFTDRDSGCGDRLGCAPGREQLDAVLGEAAGEVNETGLVRDREEGALDFHAGNDGWVTPLVKSE